MEKPEFSERFKVTERAAGTGRIEHPVPNGALAPAPVQEERGENEPPKAPSADALASGEHDAAPAFAGRGGLSVEVEATLIETGFVATKIDSNPPARKASPTHNADAALAGTIGAAADTAATPTTPKTPAIEAYEQASRLRGLCGNEHIMEAVEAVRTHPLFVQWYERLEGAEAGRPFCLHQMDHLLATARIAYIRVLERKMPFRKEMVYAAALLHDIGKAAQYESGEPHEIVGARIATEILSDVEGFSALEKTAIVAAVAQHRRYSEDASPLGKLLFEADKASRPCFACPMREECSWTPEKMNQGIKI